MSATPIIARLTLMTMTTLMTTALTITPKKTQRLSIWAQRPLPTAPTA